MGQVYGRMSVPGAVGLYSARWSAGDHHSSCPSKAKVSASSRDGNRSPSLATGGEGQRFQRRRRSLSEPTSSLDDQDEPAFRLTRNAARQLAQQQAAQQAASIRRSARLAGSRTLRGSRRSLSLTGVGTGGATLPSTLRRSARIAGFRFIGHRVAADFGAGSSPLAGARLRRPTTAGPPAAPASSRASRAPAPVSAPPALAPSEPRRSARLMRA